MFCKSNFLNYVRGVSLICKLQDNLKPLDTFGTEKKKFTDLQITYRVTEGKGGRLIP